MALPIVRSLEACADYTSTVEPFLKQLYSLPDDFVTALSSGSVARLYVETNPLVSGFAISLALGFVFLVVSEINRNYSQVDRCWSLLPTVYIAHFNLWSRLAGAHSGRLDAALLFSAIWSIRLTYNYARKGGYDVGSEDYRWEIVKNAVPKWLFHIFNLTFIAFFQSVLLFAIAAPAYTLLLTGTIERDLTFADAAFAAVEICIVAFEYVADQQQWDYQTAKYKYRASDKVPAGFDKSTLDRGFLAEGLWAYSRHPNFAAEQSVWIVLYQWSCYATGTLYSWAGIGALVLVLLFQGSTALTERITSGKYPGYREYQKQVGMFVPTSVVGFKTPAAKVLRTSELAKKQAEKEAEKEATASGSYSYNTRSAAKR
ncbi:hypothetical protein SPBR_02885 [Sporothrix brasiliensis 5110]|uniref:DUF1295 domain protein n=1 Tax=Sporothrix brasiliensis 5110 TaxID=1398154 RepID=A0A0C2IZP0_9PEZI|nr:uncharacterized protein SPBR_02885 [Sporothrix brasiliensis 5110]KIH92200.1 hypothetical protein SPBR_02885 [Sporothrix brasiliensis 5110]